MAEETGWVIERGDSEPSRPLYFVGYDFAERGSWSHDNLKAIRFARKVDAERVSASIDDGAVDVPDRICEHAWG